MVTQVTDRLWGAEVGQGEAQRFKTCRKSHGWDRKAGENPYRHPHGSLVFSHPSLEHGVELCFDLP